MDIYWIKDKRQCGPSTVPDVISQLQAGDLTPETLGWHAGCSGWQPLRELPALADFLGERQEEKAEASEEAQDHPAANVAAEEQDAPAPTSEPPAAQQELPLPGAPKLQGGSTPVYLPSPVARLLARLVDYALYTVLYGAFIQLRGIPYDATLLLTVNPLLWLPMLVLEAWLLSTWGTTPGKAVLGIRLTTFGDAPRLSFLRALLRSLMVFSFGMAFMIPQLLPIMLVFEYWMLRRRGITLWDARLSTLPTQKEPCTPSRYVLDVVLLYVSMVMFFSCMKPWMPGMLDDIGKVNPEMAQKLRSIMPAELTQQPQPAAEAPAAADPAPAGQSTSLPGI